MTTRFERYFAAQMEGPTMRELVKQELTSLQIGTLIAKLRAKRSLNQTQPAARAHMCAAKVSKIESKPTNVQLVEVNIVESEGRLKPVPKRRAATAGTSSIRIRATKIKVVSPAIRLGREPS